MKKMKPTDLNLLAIFDTVMTEKSIIKAAINLSMTQPAVSNAVNRMRQSWKDELFIKDGRNIKPTLYAENLWQQTKESLHNINLAFEIDGFNPLLSKRTFRVAVNDIVVDNLWMELYQKLEKQAPHINLHAVPYTMQITY